MESYSDRAIMLFRQGYNCCQSVIGAFADDIGLDFETTMKLASSFGAGMGRLREVCGAVSAMFMIVGLKYGYTSPTDSEGKANHYKLINELAAEFKNVNQTIICRELLKDVVTTKGYVPEPRTEQYYQSRPCEMLIGEAAEIVAKKIMDIAHEDAAHEDAAHADVAYCDSLQGETVKE